MKSYLLVPKESIETHAHPGVRGTEQGERVLLDANAGWHHQYDNTMPVDGSGIGNGSGLSGTAGNSVNFHDSEFFANAAGYVTDSFVGPEHLSPQIRKVESLVGRIGPQKGTLRDMMDVKVFVDTAPVMEKPLSEAAGLGWQGKHTNLVSRSHGSWLFLGAIYTTLDLAPDRAGHSTCGSCDACQTACPTNAFPAPYRLDARRCISYLTIEHKGPIPHEFRAAIGNHIYGCDDCLAVCPWNKFAAAAQANLAFAPRAELTAPALADLLALDDAAFREVFAGSPIKRIGRDRMVRNCLIAAGNSGSKALVAPVRALLEDPDETIREAAEWALGRLQGSHAPAEAGARGY